MPKDVVPPGDQTGVYYIPISNLPFNVSWQQIKDYVRQVCEVDHVEVFQKSTSGWIRVKGRENFDAAFAHLDGKEFNGRCILADGRNGECPILVRDLELCKPTGSTNNRPSSGDGSTASVGSTVQDTSMYAMGGPVSYSDSSVFSTPTSTTTSSSFSHQADPSSHTTSSSHSSISEPRRPLEYQCLVSMPATRELMMPRCYAQQQDGYMNNSVAMAACSTNFMTSPDMSFSQGLAGYDATAVGGGFTHPTAYEYGPLQAVQPQASFMAAAYPVATDAMYSTPTPYAVPPPISYNDYYPPTSNTAALTIQMSNMVIGPGTTGSVIYTEQRGVHIRDISRRASEDQIRKMIREVTGPEATLIETVKVPLQDGAPRGHAFVHFRSASVARRLVEHLNGTEFKGRKLQVRLMKEGDAMGSACSTTAPTTTTSTTTGSSASRQRSSRGKHHHSSQSSGTRSRSERKDRDKPEKSNSASSKPAPLVVSGGGGGGGTTASGTTASAVTTTTKEKHGSKKASPVIIADGSSARRTSDVR